MWICLPLTSYIWLQTMPADGESGAQKPTSAAPSPLLHRCTHHTATSPESPQRDLASAPYWTACPSLLPRKNLWGEALSVLFRPKPAFHMFPTSPHPYPSQQSLPWFLEPPVTGEPAACPSAGSLYSPRTLPWLALWTGACSSPGPALALLCWTPSLLTVAGCVFLLISVLLLIALSWQRRWWVLRDHGSPFFKGYMGKAPPSWVSRAATRSFHEVNTTKS